MKVILGSESEHKLNAVYGAMQTCLMMDVRLIGVSSLSGVPEQPTKNEIKRGARNRAYDAKHAQPCGDLWVGVENGIYETDDSSCYDVAFVVILDKQGREFSAMSAGHEVPKEYVKAARELGFNKHTAGSIMANKTGCSSTDGTSYITRGVLSRTHLLMQAATIAFADYLRQTRKC